MKCKYYEQVRAVQKINHLKIAQNLSFGIKLGGKEILFVALQMGGGFKKLKNFGDKNPLTRGRMFFIRS
jgi:hypothetical protein